MTSWENVFNISIEDYVYKPNAKDLEHLQSAKFSPTHLSPIIPFHIEINQKAQNQTHLLSNLLRKKHLQKINKPAVNQAKKANKLQVKTSKQTQILHTIL